MKSPLRWFVAVLALLLIAIAVRWSVRPARSTSGGGNAAAAAGETAGISAKTGDTTSGLPVSVRLEAIRARLLTSGDAAASRRLLAEVRELLGSLSPADASHEAQAFLATTRDASTSLQLTVEEGGALGDASSLRVALLDYLGRIDRQAAGAVAERILSSYTTPDEWAVSLRNYAWANPGPTGEAFLQAKALQMLGNAAWVENPSAGFLEAFDVIVHARGTALLPELAALVRDRDNRAAGHAAYLTVDRLTIAEPAIMLKQMIDQPGLMAGREQTRASLFARADVREPVQRALVEQYLLDPTRPAGELATFAGLYPNANHMVSRNLLTPVATPSGEQLAAHDREALRVIEQWLADPRFEELQPQLGQIQRRLATFVRQAASGY